MPDAFSAGRRALIRTGQDVDRDRVRSSGQPVKVASAYTATAGLLNVRIGLGSGLVWDEFKPDDGGDDPADEDDFAHRDASAPVAIA